MPRFNFDPLGIFKRQLLGMWRSGAAGIRSDGARKVRGGIGRGLWFDPGPSNPDYVTGDNELPVQEKLEAVLQRGDTVYDVGANVGFFTVLAAQLVGPAGRVFAFEPLPANVGLLQRNVALNSFENVRVIEQAVFRESGSTELSVAEYSGGGMLRQVGEPPDASGRYIEVVMTTLDDFVLKAGNPPPTFVKVDVEGAELDVLIGMHQVLSSHRPWVLFEVDDATPEGMQAKLLSCSGFLREFGYEVELLPASYPSGGWCVAHALATPQK